MSPHKPDPLPRTVDVDLSGILVRPDESDRPALRSGLETENIFPGAWKESPASGRIPSISGSEWASMIFAIGACLIGIFCTLWTFEDLDQFKRLAYPAPDAMYIRPELRANKSQRLVSKKPHLPRARQSSEPAGSGMKETTDSSKPAPPLSMFSPVLWNNNSPLLATNGPFANNGSSSAPSSGPGRSSMSAEGSSESDAANSKQKNATHQSHASNSTSPARRSLTSTKPLSGGNNFRNHFVDASRESKIGKSALRVAPATQASSGRIAMSMLSMQSGMSMLQNRLGINAMGMQHGLVAQPAAVAGLNVGLNGAGVGGGNGGGHRGGNARR